MAPRSCAVQRTVVLSTISGASYLPDAVALAASVAAATSFPCIRLAYAAPLTDAAVASASPHLESLQLPVKDWRPPQVACIQKQSGYRKTSVLK